MEEKKIRPQDKWNAKAGLISKSYKLKRELVEAFADACEKAGVSQAGQLSRMMSDFIEKKQVNTRKGKVLTSIHWLVPFLFWH